MDETYVPRRAAPARDRDALVGLRQLGDALPRVPLAGRRARRPGANRRRGARAPAHRLLPARRAAHPVGSRSTTTATLRRLAEASRASGSARSTPTSSATTTTGSAASATPTRPFARRRSSTAASAFAIAEQVGSNVISLWLADGTNYPGQDDLRGRYARLVDGLEELYAAAAARACGCSSSTSSSSPGFYSTDLPDWGTAALHLPPARPAGAGARRHRPPPAGDERRADRRRAAGRRAARRLPLQQPQVRRRRPDRRSIDPFELFRIMREIARAPRPRATSRS